MGAHFFFIKPVALVDLRPHAVGQRPGVGVLLAGQVQVGPLAAFGGEESRALGVVFFLVEVLTAIQLDDQFLARGAKVGDVRPNGVLAAEMDSIGALSAQIWTQFGFGRSLLSTQFARRMHHLRRGAFGFLDELLLPAPSQPPPFSPHRERGASGRKMGEEQLLMEREAD